MNQESCCCCARLLAHIGSNGSGSEPPSYSVSAASSVSHPPIRSTEKSLSFDSFDENGGREESFLEKNATYDWEKDGDGDREGLQNYNRDTHDWREKEDGNWKEGRGRGDRRLSGDIIDGDTTLDLTRLGLSWGDEPPSYESLLHSSSSNAKTDTPLNTHLHTLSSKSQPQAQTEDTLHFLDHASDSMTSLSLRYGVPIDVLRKKNGITSDHLLLARKTILIPGEWYKGGVSLSPQPVEGEEEERRKVYVRKFMVGCKVAEYDIAVLYLEQSNYDLELAMGVYKDDERWENENPILDRGKGKGRTKLDVGRRRFTGLRS
ncbi:hypothetical protein NHQ30_005665 [Ciborinia camelliae]|nr:hypothetical protein NHQ30_005665 [Ciborinia camelliae]